MKLRLLILLAAALAASPAAGQTIKSLGYNTTNGNVVAATNVTFTNSVGFATNARAATRTNLGGTTVGNAVFTATNDAAARSAIGAGTVNEGGEPTFQSITLSDSPDTLTLVANVTNFRTAIGLGATNSVVFAGGFTNNVGVGVGGSNTGLASDGTLSGRLGLIKNGNIIAELSENNPFFGLYYPITFQGGNAVSNAAATRTNLALGATNNVTFSNITASGTLAVTGNVTMSGVDNLATQQTASSGSSLMTRNLYDERLPITFGLADQAQADFGTVTLANGASGSKTAGGFETTTGTSNNATVVWNASSQAAFGRKSTAGSGGVSTVWAGRVMVGWWFSRALSDNSEIRFQYGRAFNATTHAALSARGVGVRIATNSVFFETHNGTTGFETTNVVTATNPMFYSAIVEAGVAKFYAGQTLVATVTNSVPTNNTTDNDFGWVMSISNTSTNSSIMRVFGNPGFVMQQ